MKNNRGKNRVIFDYLSNIREMVKTINKLVKPKKKQQQQNQ